MKKLLKRAELEYVEIPNGYRCRSFDRTVEFLILIDIFAARYSLSFCDLAQKPFEGPERDAIELECRLYRH
jgi:hypothetical protein